MKLTWEYYRRERGEVKPPLTNELVLGSVILEKIPTEITDRNPSSISPFLEDGSKEILRSGNFDILGIFPKAMNIA
jgi:hypothetical protein